MIDVITMTRVVVQRTKYMISSTKANCAQLKEEEVMTHSMMIDSKIFCSGLPEIFLNLTSETALLATERLYW